MKSLIKNEDVISNHACSGKKGINNVSLIDALLKTLPDLGHNRSPLLWCE